MQRVRKFKIVSTVQNVQKRPKCKNCTERQKCQIRPEYQNSPKCPNKFETTFSNHFTL